MLSKACKYAIRAMIYLATQVENGGKTNIRDLAVEIDSPEPFTAKIMQTLSKQSLVSSLKGPNGGFFLTDEQARIPLLEIVKAIDGLGAISSCGLGLRSCSDVNPCPIHTEFSHIRNGFAHLLKENTIAHLAIELQEGKAQLNNIV
jgi:Rrf2 family protein